MTATQEQPAATPGPEPASRGSTEQGEAVERLMLIADSMATWLEDAEPHCNRGNHDGGGIYPCDHCDVLDMTTEARAALAVLGDTAGRTGRDGQGE